MEEQEQRVIYEWFYPELPGKDWKLLHHGIATWQAHWDRVSHFIAGRLYTPDGKPNINFFMHECVPKLRREGVDCTWDSVGSVFNLWSREGYHLSHNADPWLAVSEYLKGV